MAWKIAGTVFRGGTQEARALAGKRVRARRTLMHVNVYNPNGAKDDTMTVAPFAEGIIGHVPPGQPDLIVLAFPADAGVRLLSLEQAARQRIRSILVNWPTFRDAFEIDV